MFAPGSIIGIATGVVLLLVFGFALWYKMFPNSRVASRINKLLNCNQTPILPTDTKRISHPMPLTPAYQPTSSVYKPAHTIIIMPDLTPTATFAGTSTPGIPSVVVTSPTITFPVPAHYLGSVREGGPVRPLPTFPLPPTTTGASLCGRASGDSLASATLQLGELIKYHDQCPILTETNLTASATATAATTTTTAAFAFATATAARAYPKPPTTKTRALPVPVPVPKSNNPYLDFVLGPTPPLKVKTRSLREPATPIAAPHLVPDPRFVPKEAFRPKMGVASKIPPKTKVSSRPTTKAHKPPPLASLDMNVPQPRAPYRDVAKAKMPLDEVDDNIPQPRAAIHNSPNRTTTTGKVSSRPHGPTYINFPPLPPLPVATAPVATRSAPVPLAPRPPIAEAPVPLPRRPPASPFTKAYPPGRNRAPLFVEPLPQLATILENQPPVLVSPRRIGPNRNLTSPPPISTNASCAAAAIGAQLPNPGFPQPLAALSPLFIRQNMPTVEEDPFLSPWL